MSTKEGRNPFHEDPMPTDTGRLADALELVRQGCNLLPYDAYGPEPETGSVAEAFQTLVLALDRYSTTFTDEDCTNAIQWCMNVHGLLDW